MQTNSSEKRDKCVKAQCNSGNKIQKFPGEMVGIAAPSENKNCSLFHRLKCASSWS